MGKTTDDKIHIQNHSKCMLGAFQNFRQDETMLDVTLVCNGKSLKAHKLVLSSCSDFFKELFSENPCKHPIVILRHFDFDDLKAIIDFIYKGELSIPRERLISVLNLAEDLNIRGLMPKERNKPTYEKLYNQVCRKLSNRKKRKRHRHNSTDSEGNESIKVSDSEQNIELDFDDATPSESQIMDVESVNAERELVTDKEARPLVLHVGDSTSNEGSFSKLEKGDCIEDNSVERNLPLNMTHESFSAAIESTEAGVYETAAENIESSSQFDSNTAYSENSNLGYIPEDEQSNSQDQSMEYVPAAEDLTKESGFMSCLSPNSKVAQHCEETKLPEKGKRFVCSKCDNVFTSRINFMKHKALGHNNTEKCLYECQFCTFTTADVECLNEHILKHADSVPYKCSTCSEEFTSEEVYENHISLHEAEEIAQHGFSAVTEQDFFSTQNENSAKNLEFRCSICFVKFSSKLRCQFHEKTCQGGS